MGIRMGSVLGACVAASAIVVGLTGCSNTVNSANVNELEQRGFTNIVESTYVGMMDGDIGTYFADAGGCRVVLRYAEYPIEPGTEWVLVEKSSQGKGSDILLPNPTALKVGAMDAFQYCFETKAPAT